MKKKFNPPFKTGIFLFVILLLIMGCSKEDSSEIEPNEIWQIQNEFSLEHFNDIFVKNNLEIDWNNFNIYKDPKVDAYRYEFNTTSGIKNTLQNKEQKFHNTYKLLAFKNEGNTWELEIIKFVYNDSEKLNQITSFSLASFSGTLYYYDLEGNTVNAKVYKNGQIISVLSNKTLEADSSAARAPDGSGWVLIWIESWTDWYANNGAGGEFQYTHSTYNGSRSEYVFVEGNGYTGYDPTSTGEYHEHFDYDHGGSGGTYNHDNENIVDGIEDVPPSCESFNYSRVGGTNWQCAAVSDIHELFTIISWECIGYDWGVFTQPLYFQLPVNATYSLDSGSTKIESAAYLDSAFKAFDNWYQENGCTSGAPALEQTLLEYIKDEFEENGGSVTLTPPPGFTGTPTSYKITWSGYGDCN